MDIIQLFTNNIQIGNITLPLSISELILNFILPLVIIRLVLFLIQKVIDPLIIKADIHNDFRQRLIRTEKFVIRIVFLLALVILASLLFGNELLSILSAIITVLSEPFFTSGDLRISLLTLIATIPVFLIASWVGKTSRGLVDASMRRYMKLSDSLRFSISNILGYLVMFLVIITGLGLIGINLSSLLLLLGVLGIGIGFGLQNTVANFFAGLIIIISRPIKVNDYILLDTGSESIEGTIVKITLLHSVLNSVLNESIIIPNAGIISQSVHNLSYDSSEVIISVDVAVHYNSDINRVEELLVALAEDCPSWNGRDAAQVIIRNFADSGIELRLLVSIRNARERLKAKAWIRRAMWQCFRDNNIVIPYPQLDVHIAGSAGNNADTILTRKGEGSEP